MEHEKHVQDFGLDEWHNLIHQVNRDMHVEGWH